jgi:hypothetical protein
MQRRGEISNSVIIGFAIGLLALVIVSVLIIRAGLGAGRGTSCEGVGGHCEQGSGLEACSITQGVTPSAHPCGEGQTCCIPIAGRDDG